MRIFTENRTYQEDADFLFKLLATENEISYSSARAIENSDVFTVVNLLASDVASLDVEKRVDSVVTRDSVTRLLNIKPNNLYSGGTLKFILVANALLNGESFCEIIKKDGRLLALNHLPNSCVTVKRDDTTRYNLEYHIETKTKTKTSIRKLKPENVLHFKFFTLDGIVGYSPLRSLRDDLSMQKDSKRFLSNFFKNDTQTGGILRMKHGKLSKEARDKIKDEWHKSNSGVNNAHKVLVIDDTFEYEPIEVDTEILKLINASTYSTETIGKTFRIPRHKLGLETSNMSLAQANLDYLTSTLNSYLKVITNELNFKLLTSDRESFEFDTSPFKTVDIEAHTKLTVEKFDKGLISLNEARRQIGDKPIDHENGNKHFVSLNYTTLDQLEDYQMNRVTRLKGGDTHVENGDSET